jgi:MHS family proline/betaine transporter-like MFS transporter
MSFLKKYKNVISGLSINAMESFDFVLYGYYATLIAPVFFPDKDPKSGQLKALLIFSAMFIMKPLGGLIFGHIGDKYGRKFSLILSVLVISIPTFFIGVLPGYATLGFLAPLLLVIALSFQGLGAAAAYSGAAIFLNEHAKPHTKSLFSGFLFSAAFLGAAFASLLGIFFVSYYPTWGWRIVFILGAFLGLCILKLRNNLEETPQFKVLSKKKNVSTKTPFKEILKKRKRNLLCTVGIAAGANLPFYVILIYINSTLSIDLSIPSTEILTYNVYILLFWAAILPFFGYLGDKIGEKKLMMYSASFLILFPVPIMSWFLAEKTLFSLMTSRVALSLISVGIVAPCSAFLARLFATNERQTGVGFGYFLGAAIFGGTAPSLCLYFSSNLEIALFPGFYLSLFGFITVVSLYFSKPIKE